MKKHGTENNENSHLEIKRRHDNDIWKKANIEYKKTDDDKQVEKPKLWRFGRRITTSKNGEWRGSESAHWRMSSSSSLLIDSHTAHQNTSYFSNIWLDQVTLAHFRFFFVDCIHVVCKWFEFSFIALRLLAEAALNEEFDSNFKKLTVFSTVLPSLPVSDHQQFSYSFHSPIQRVVISFNFFSFVFFLSFFPSLCIETECWIVVLYESVELSCFPFDLCRRMQDSVSVLIIYVSKLQLCKIFQWENVDSLRCTRKKTRNQIENWVFFLKFISIVDLVCMRPVRKQSNLFYVSSPQQPPRKITHKPKIFSFSVPSNFKELRHD